MVLEMLLLLELLKLLGRGLDEIRGVQSNRRVVAEDINCLEATDLLAVLDEDGLLRLLVGLVAAVVHHHHHHGRCLVGDGACVLVLLLLLLLQLKLLLLLELKLLVLVLDTIDLLLLLL